MCDDILKMHPTVVSKYRVSGKSWRAAIPGGFAFSRPMASRDGTVRTTTAGNALFLMEGFHWNGPSMFPDLPFALVPSGFHDAMYLIISESDMSKKERKAARKAADLMFRKQLRACGCPMWLSIVMYLAVRIFGGLFV